MKVGGLPERSTLERDEAAAKLMALHKDMRRAEAKLAMLDDEASWPVRERVVREYLEAHEAHEAQVRRAKRAFAVRIVV